jgi:imidazolonepropionase-like amidohydrolase
MVFSYTNEAAAARGVRRLMSGSRLALVGGTLIDGTDAKPVRDAVILMEDGVIKAVGPHSAVHVPQSTETLDVTGQWVIPGLIDCHIHLCGETTLDMYKRYLTPDPEVKLLTAMRHAFLALTSGFTTVRDVGLGHAVTLRHAIHDGLIAGPRILASNSALTTTGGHGDWTIFPYEWAKSMELRGNIVDGPDECRIAVRRAFRGGADLIKVFLSSGGITNHAHDLTTRAEFSPEEVDAIVDEAHRRGAKVAAHSTGLDAVAMALAGGVDTIEHGVFEPDPKILATMVEKNISLVPTVFIFKWVAEQGKSGGVFDEGVEAAKRLIELQYRLVRAAQSAGVNVALGSDNTGALGPDRSARELELFCEAGLTPLQAIQAGTRNAARACGLAERVGTLEVGKLGEMVVLKQDPLADITSLTQKGTISTIVQSAVN